MVFLRKTGCELCISTAFRLHVFSNKSKQCKDVLEKVQFGNDLCSYISYKFCKVDIVIDNVTFYDCPSETETTKHSLSVSKKNAHVKKE